MKTAEFERFSVVGPERRRRYWFERRKITSIATIPITVRKHIRKINTLRRPAERLAGCVVANLN